MKKKNKLVFVKDESKIPIPRKQVQQILEMRRGLMLPLEQELCNRAQVPGDATEHTVDFMQVVGDVIPLCWIPVADIQMVVKLLHQYLPEPTLRASREQFLGVIKALNEYVGEALDRNAKKDILSTYTWTDAEKKKGKK